MDSLLSALSNELLAQDIAEPSAVLGLLSNAELQFFYDRVLELFAFELVTGALHNSDWSNGELVIAANHRQIHLLQAAAYSVKLEIQRRSCVPLRG